MMDFQVQDLGTDAPDHLCEVCAGLGLSRIASFGIIVTDRFSRYLCPPHLERVIGLLLEGL